MNQWRVFIAGVFKRNPVLVMALGGCPTLAVTTSAINGLGMGLATMFVLTASNAAISALKNFIPDNVRIPSYIVVIAAFVTFVDVTMAAYTPGLHAQLGIFIPLIVANCIPLERAESFAAKNSVWSAAVDGAGVGIGFTWVLMAIGGIREVLGSGALFGHKVYSGDGVIFFVLAPGAFLCFGFLMALVNKLMKTKAAAPHS